MHEGIRAAKLAADASGFGPAFSHRRRCRTDGAHAEAPRTSHSITRPLQPPISADQRPREGLAFWISGPDRRKAKTLKPETACCALCWIEDGVRTPANVKSPGMPICRE